MLRSSTEPLAICQFLLATGGELASHHRREAGTTLKPGTRDSFLLPQLLLRSLDLLSPADSEERW